MKLPRMLVGVLIAGPFLSACLGNSDADGATPGAVGTARATVAAASTEPTASPSGQRATPSVAASPTPDLFNQASQPAFPDAEVVHVVLVAEPYNYDDDDAPNTTTEDTWINQTNGDVVVRTTDQTGALRSLTVRNGLTVEEFRAEPDSGDFTSLSVTTVLSTDDPNLPDPLDFLNLGRAMLERGVEEIERRGGTVEYDSAFEGRPAIQLVVPMYENDQKLGMSTIYLDHQTLYPLAWIGPDGKGTKVSYPVIETLELEHVPDGTFDPEIPQAAYTYVRERLSPEAAAAFTDYPIWWLGPEHEGYELQWIERYRTTTPEDVQIANDQVTVFYLADADDYENQLQIISEPPLTDIEWAHRDANHNVHGFEQIEIQGNRAWKQPGNGFVEVDFTDSWVSLNAPTDEFALKAAASLRRTSVMAWSLPALNSNFSTD